MLQHVKLNARRTRVDTRAYHQADTTRATMRVAMLKLETLNAKRTRLTRA
jgi:hypothetical protein